MAASQPAVRSAHPYKMYDQIISQADQIALVLERERDHCAELAERLGRCRRILCGRHRHLLARGAGRRGDDALRTRGLARQLVRVLHGHATARGR